MIAMFDVLRVLSLVAAELLTIVWLFQLLRRTRERSTARLRFGPSWAIASWFIPAVNLVLPVFVIHGAWKANDPEGRNWSTANSWMSCPGSPLVIGWWVTFASAAVSTRAARVLDGPGYYDAPYTIGCRSTVHPRRRPTSGTP